MVSYLGDDTVPCLPIPLRISDACADRLRRLSWLPAAALADITSGGLHLVPVGRHGSPTERVEWRLSFSRPEAILARCMAPAQRRVLIALKMCKHRVNWCEGMELLKSYYLLTTVFWYCLDTPLCRWGSLTAVAAGLLDRLAAAVDRRHLPCFFMETINVLQCDGEEEWVSLAAGIRSMQREFSDVMLSHCLSYSSRMERYVESGEAEVDTSQAELGSDDALDTITQGILGTIEDRIEQISLAGGVGLLQHELTDGMLKFCLRIHRTKNRYLKSVKAGAEYSETEFRTCVTRETIIWGLLWTILDYIELASLLSEVARRGNHSLHRALLTPPQHRITRPRRALGDWLLAALKWAPASVANRVRLRRTSDVTWVWDVAPLLELLTDTDWKYALYGADMEAALDWCDVQNKLPAERRAGGAAERRSPPHRAQSLQNIVSLVLFLLETRPDDFEYQDELAKTWVGVLERLRDRYLLPPGGEFDQLCSRLTEVGVDDSTARIVADRVFTARPEDWSSQQAAEHFDTAVSRQLVQHPWGVYRYRL